MMFFETLFIGRLTLQTANECTCIYVHVYSIRTPTVKNTEDVKTCKPVFEFCFRSSLTTKNVSQTAIVIVFSVSTTSVWMKLAFYNVCKYRFLFYPSHLPSVLTFETDD